MYHNQSPFAGVGYNFDLEKVDGLGINCDDLPVQHFRDGHSRSLPLAAWIIEIVDRDHCVSVFYGLQVRLELAAHGFPIGRVYDFRTDRQSIEILLASGVFDHKVSGETN